MEQYIAVVVDDELHYSIKICRWSIEMATILKRQTDRQTDRKTPPDKNLCQQLF